MDGRYDCFSSLGYGSTTPEAPYVCRYCGAPSWTAPDDQSPPPDYCHPEDHGMTEE